MPRRSPRLPVPERDEEQRDLTDVVSPGLAKAIIVTILALIVVVVIVGLARKDLDPLGVITVLGTMFSGFLTAIVLRGRGGGTS